MRKKINVSIAAFLVLDILFSAFVIWPAFSEIQRSSSELSSRLKELSGMEAKAANLEKFSSLYKNLEDVLQKINDLLVNRDVPVEFISYLENTAVKSGVRLGLDPVSVNPGKDDLWPSLAFRAGAEGSYPDFMEFLEKLEASPYLIEIQQLSIASQGGGISADMLIKVYTKQ